MRGRGPQRKSLGFSWQISQVHFDQQIQASFFKEENFLVRKMLATVHFAIDAVTF